MNDCVTYAWIVGIKICFRCKHQLSREEEMGTSLQGFPKMIRAVVLITPHNTVDRLRTSGRVAA